MTSSGESRLTRTSTIVTIAGTVLGTVIAYMSLAAAVHWPPFSPSPSVSVFRGEAPATVDTCRRDATCGSIGVELRHFSGASVVCSFSSSVGSSKFDDQVVSVDSDGYGRVQTGNWFSGQGWVSATCGGVQSEPRSW